MARPDRDSGDSAARPDAPVTGRWLIACGGASALLHLVVFVTQRAIQRGPESAGGPGFAWSLAAYALATCGLFAVYGAVVVACSRNRIATARDRRLAILFPVAFSAALLPTTPSLSIDVYSYMAHGHMQAAMGLNPYVRHSRAVAGTPYGRELAAHGWRPVHPVSPYGPIVTHLERIIAGATPDVRLQIVLFKALAVAATLGCAAAIWAILGRLRPDRQQLGTVVFLWNPLIVWELAGEGHNDAVMLLGILLALALAVRRRHAAGITVIALAVLTKYVPAILAPLLAVHAVRTTRRHRRLAAATALGVSGAAALAWVLFRPLWVGLETFRGVRLNGAPGSTGSTPTMVLETLERLAPWLRWEGILWAALAVALGASVLWRAWRVTDGPTLLREAALVWTVYVLLLSPSYWPWYATTAVALLALVPQRPFLDVVFALSLSARLAAPLVMLFVHGLTSRAVFLASMWGVGVGIPLIVLALHARTVQRDR